MSNFFTKIFKPSSKKSNRENFQPLEDYGQRNSTIKQNSRNEFETGILKSSMRRRNTAQPYDDEFLRAPGAAYHTSAQQQRHRGPKSLPPSRTFEDSPNASPSSSTDGGLERSFHSEFIPSSQPSTSRRRNKKHRIPASDFYPSRDERNNKYLKEESDSESARIMVEEEMYNAMKQIKKYRTGLSEAIGKYRQIKTDFDKLLKEKHSLAFSMIEKDHKIQQLESEIAQLSQEKRSLEIENQSLKSIGYSYAGPQHRYHHHYPPTYPQPPTHYSYMTPPSQIRSTQFNNTNTGSVMASGGGERNSNNNNNFRGPRHRVVEHLFGNINDGSGEQLAFLSANTTASQVVLPGIPIIPNNTDDINDEIKNFRVADESSPSRPPTNSNPSLILSTGIGGSNSTGSSPPNNKTNEQTPVASIKKGSSPKSSNNSKINAFNEIILKQLNSLTPKSSKVRKAKSLSTMDDIAVNFEAPNLNQ